ncbi:MAG: hypothetical protein K2G84_05790, partial [Muribaculaceae bacterium]|nr:hypothetical protein [Muribaculaceae bacterium]
GARRGIGAQTDLPTPFFSRKTSADTIFFTTPDKLRARPEPTGRAMFLRVSPYTQLIGNVPVNHAGRIGNVPVNFFGKFRK